MEGLCQPFKTAEVFGQLLAEGDVVGLVEFDEPLVDDTVCDQVEELHGGKHIVAHLHLAFHLEPVFLGA